MTAQGSFTLIAGGVTVILQVKVVIVLKDFFTFTVIVAVPTLFPVIRADFAAVFSTETTSLLLDLKVTVCLKGKINGYVLGEVLENNKIFAELVGKDHILFMLSYAFSLEQANKIVSALDSVVLNADSQNKEDDFYSLPKRKVSYLQAKNLPYEEVSLKDSLGRICAENAGLFPPCYPLIIAGEVFDNEVIDALLNKNTFGVYNGKVKVCKE